MPEHPKKPKFEAIQEGASDARRRRRADRVLASPNITLDMITQDVADGLLDAEIMVNGGISTVGIELLPDLCERIIDRIASRLAVSTAEESFEEHAAREHLQALFDIALRKYY